jgi:AcrR family transcriptional regulator
MAYHKENLKERLIEIAWEICKEGSWRSINMRLVAEKAGVSTTAFYRHFKNKDDLKAALMLKGFQLLSEGIEDPNIEDKFSAYGAHTIKFGLEHPYIYDLMFENNNINISHYPELEAISDFSFSGIVKGVQIFIPDASEKELMIKAINIWASIHGLIGILRRARLQTRKTKELEWIENNLEEYLKMTTFR